MTARRRWLLLLVVAAVAAAGTGAAVLLRHGSASVRCASRVPADSPLDAPSRFGEDPHVAALAAAVGASSAFGPVRAGVGYNYGQWLHLYGVVGGALAFTKDNAPVTVLGADPLQARWALRPATSRIAWDASARRFVLLDLADHPPVRVGSYNLADGRERWCVALTARQRAGEPVSTAVLDDGDVLVVLPGSSGLEVRRLSGADGHTRWVRPLTGVGRADFLAPVGADAFVAGGDEAFRLAQDDRPGGGFGVFSLVDGRERARATVPAQQDLHVVGTLGDQVLALVARPGQTRLEGIGLDGRRRWSTVLPGATLDSTLRGDVVLVRTRGRLLALRAADGSRSWSRPLPRTRTYFPYGFLLDQVPTLDTDHVLLPTTTALVSLDLRDGSERAYPLPTDGIRTTYWPYQLVVTDQLLGVVTNTAAVLADREPVS